MICRCAPLHSSGYGHIADGIGAGGAVHRTAPPGSRWSAAFPPPEGFIGKPAVWAVQSAPPGSAVGSGLLSLWAMSSVSTVRDVVSRVATDSNASQLDRPVTPSSAVALARPDPARWATPPADLKLWSLRNTETSSGVPPSASENRPRRLSDFSSFPYEPRNFFKGAGSIPSTRAFVRTSSACPSAAGASLSGPTSDSNSACASARAGLACMASRPRPGVPPAGHGRRASR
jgi:hypothetical protein